MRTLLLIGCLACAHSLMVNESMAFTVRGTTVDLEARPLGNARINAYRVNRNGVRELTAFSNARSDARTGEYEIEVGEGFVVLEFRRANAERRVFIAGADSPRDGGAMLVSRNIADFTVVVPDDPTFQGECRTKRHCSIFRRRR